jgi:hypothetical protein
MPEIVFSAKASENTYSSAERGRLTGITKAHNCGPVNDETAYGGPINTFKEMMTADHEGKWQLLAR